MNALIIFAGILNLYLGLFVWLKDKKKKLNIYFGLLGLIGSIWCFNNFMTGISQIPTFWLKGAYAWGSLVLSTGLVWTLVLSDSKKLIVKSFLIYALSLFFFSFSYISNYIINKVNIVYLGGFEGTTGPLFIYYSIYSLLIGIAIIAILWLSYKKAIGIKKYQLLYVLLGASFYLLTSLLVSFVLPLYGIFNLMFLDSVSSIFFILAIAYSITRYRFLGLRSIFNSVIIFITLSFFILLAHYSILWSNEKLLDLNSENPFIVFVVNFIVALVFTSLFIPIYHYARRFSETIIYNNHDPRRLVKDFTLKLNQQLRLKELTKETARVFKRTLDAEKVTVLVFKNHFGNIKIAYKTGDFKLSPEMIKSVGRSHKIIIRDELCLNAGEGYAQSECHEMIEAGASIIAPVFFHNEIIGVIILGDKIGRNAYTKEEIDFIENLSHHLGGVLANALSYEHINNRNQTLEKLQKEFLANSSNYLRSPIFILKGVLAMANRAETPDEKRREYLASSLERAGQISETIDNILLAAQLGTDKLNLEMKPTNLAKILTSMVEEKNSLAEEKNLELKFKSSLNEPVYIMSDKAYLEQILSNLLNNAIRYTTIGSVVVKLAKEGKYAIVEIADTGIGITRADQPKVFQKFFKGKNNFNREGLGLGLYLAKRIISAHLGAEIKIGKNKNGTGTIVKLKFLITEKLEF